MVDGYAGTERGWAMSVTRLMAVDLDGTLVSVNTLHVYMRLGLRQMMRRGRIWRLCKSSAMLLLRKLHMVSHRTMKFAVLSCIDADADMRERFCEAVRPRFNADVMQLIDSWRKDGNVVLLATAAAETYVPWLWQGDYVATSMTGNVAREEMRGERKRRAVEEYAAGHGLLFSVAVSDHHHDLPMLSGARDEAVLVNPTPELCKEMSALPNPRVLCQRSQS